MSKTLRLNDIIQKISEQLTSNVLSGLSTAASAAKAGVVTTEEQTFAGVKTFQDGIVTPSSMTFRNKIINGDMRLVQRYGTGKRTNPSAAAYDYSIDRWSVYQTTANSISSQQFALATSDAPLQQDGQTYYLRANKETASTAQDTFIIQQAIEGQNAADLNWGTAYAKPVTLTFWAKASTSANFCVSLCNLTQSATASYVSPIDVTTTWKKFSIVVPGPTTGTWASDTSCGVSVRFVLGGASTTSLVNQWKLDNAYVGGTTQFGSLSSGSYFDVTGVQFEVGSASTAFEHRPIQAELAMCQRYYEKSYAINVNPRTNSNPGSMYHLGTSDSSSNSGPYIQFSVTKRTTPNFAAITTAGANGWIYSRSGVGATTATAINTTFLGPSGGLVYIGVGAAWVPCSISGHWTAEAEL
jgi:hypothetical protein